MIATAQQQFDVLFTTLHEIQTGLISSTAQVAGFLLLATGWIATSQTAQTFLRTDKSARYLAVASLGGAFMLYVAASLKTFLVSRKALALLKGLNFMPSENFVGRSIDVPIILVLLLVTCFSLC